jgi:phosphoadenosine phosphosulfate reductase
VDGPENCSTASRGARQGAERRRCLDHRSAPRAGPTRASTEHVEHDEKRGIAKYNPLAFWTEKDLFKQIFDRDLPYHPLHDQGYASIGCAPCTLPGDGRDGRWAGTDKTECGIHVQQVIT